MAATAKPRPILSDEQFEQMVAVMNDADSVELKVTVPEDLDRVADLLLRGSADARRLRNDVPAEHHESDRPIVGVNRSMPGVAFGDLIRVGERIRNRADKPPLRRRDTERDNLVAVLICDRAKDNRARQLGHKRRNNAENGRIGLP